ncbi:Glucokinase [Hexamita inflata]|uniref:Glucokinase n=1 Tax=Hexamita inflata TaxID=28002 RepID=A0AA86PQS5_9EUKA|nr:Glucokinase [Hexamita inflata]
MLSNYSLNLPPVSCCLAIAGPVIKHTDRQEVTLTNQNHKTIVDSLEYSKQLNIPCRIINDFEAVGYYLSRERTKADFAVLQEGTSLNQQLVLYIGAGTGLGVGFLFKDNVFPSEGGHTRFPAENEFEKKFIQSVHEEIGYKHLSCDRVISGLGIARLYNFVADMTVNDVLNGIDEVVEVFGGKITVENKTIKEILNVDVTKDIAYQVSSKALEGNEVARLVMGIFFYWYGRTIADHIVTFLPKHVYVTGGIIVKNLKLVTQDELIKGIFHKAIERKGRMGVITKGVPISVILSGDVGLLGCSAAINSLE